MSKNLARRLLGLLTLSVLLFRFPAEAQPSQGPFSITITAEKAEVKPGTDVYIKVQMKNTSDHEVDCTRNPTNGWDEVYQLDVRDVRGNPLQPKILVPGFPEFRGTSHYWPCLLQSGKATNDDNIISRRFDMSRPGKYRVQVSRLIAPPHRERGVVKSNIITITVLP